MIKVRGCPRLIRVAFTCGKLSVSIHEAVNVRAAPEDA